MRKSRREVTRELGEQPWIARILRESFLLNRDEYLGQAVLLWATYWLKEIVPVAVFFRRWVPKGEASSNCTAPRLIQIQKYGGVVLRSPQEPVGHANWLQKLSFAFLPCVSMRSRHIAIADTAARPSQGRRSRKVMIIVPVSWWFIGFDPSFSVFTPVLRKIWREVTRKVRFARLNC